MKFIIFRCINFYNEKSRDVKGVGSLFILFQETFVLHSTVFANYTSSSEWLALSMTCDVLLTVYTWNTDNLTLKIHQTQMNRQFKSHYLISFNKKTHHLGRENHDEKNATRTWMVSIKGYWMIGMNDDMIIHYYGRKLVSSIMQKLCFANRSYFEQSKFGRYLTYFFKYCAGCEVCKKKRGNKCT